MTVLFYLVWFCVVSCEVYYPVTSQFSEWLTVAGYEPLGNSDIFIIINTWGNPVRRISVNE